MADTKFYTDYPIEEFGDVLGKKAPIRKVEILFWDMDKYVTVYVQGPTHKLRTSIKRGYIYYNEGRCGDVACVTINDLNEIQAANFLKLREAALFMQTCVGDLALEGNCPEELFKAQGVLAAQSKGSGVDFERIRNAKI